MGLASIFLTGVYITGRATNCSASCFSILALGIKFFLAKSVSAPVNLGRTADRIEEHIGQRFHPQTAFMTGFVRVLANPGVMMGWVLFAAKFISGTGSRLICPAGWRWKAALDWHTGVVSGYSVAVFRGYGKWSENAASDRAHFRNRAHRFCPSGRLIAKQMVDNHREHRGSTPARQQH